MEHRLRPGVAGGPDGLFTDLYSVFQEKSVPVVFQAISIILAVTFAPALLVLVIVLFAAPTGIESTGDLTFWIAASTGLGLALVAGFALLTHATRYILRFTCNLERESVNRFQPDLVAEISDSLSWIDDLPTTDDRP